MESNWQFWIDVGGTFTDCIGISPTGEKRVSKVLSSGQVIGRAIGKSSNNGPESGFVSQELKGQCPHFWDGYAAESGSQVSLIRDSTTSGEFDLESAGEIASSSGNLDFRIQTDMPAAIFAIRKTLDLPLAQSLPVVDVRLGTTRGTNALLTRSGARVALLTTSGFGDLLRIGYQNRPKLFAVDIKKPDPLFEISVEVQERILADGTVEIPLDRLEVQRQLKRIYQSGIHSLAICLMHSYQYPQHEQIIAELAKETGFVEISVSHQVAPEIRIIPRAYTTVLDAYLNPVLREYVAGIRGQLSSGSRLKLFSSSGALVASDEFTGKDSILSGPAGGVVGFSKTAALAGISKSIGFDMGGTSTDVSRFDGQYGYQYEVEKSGVFIVAPTLSIETVAAGGGSICDYDGMRFLVGPQSAGADPGPACYGNGGPLCLTDVNLFLGRIDGNAFPFPLDRSAVVGHLEKIQKQIAAATNENRSLDWIAEGFLRIAVAKTAQAIRLISLQKGYSVTEYALVSFGGAAGQICCPVAEELGIKKILIHPQASVLSAYGIGLADEVLHRSLGIYSSWSKELNLQESFAKMEEAVGGVGDRRGVEIRFRRKIDLRYEGTQDYLTLDYDAHDKLPRQFEAAHQKRFGFSQEQSVEIGSIRVEGILSSVAPNRKNEPGEMFQQKRSPGPLRPDAEVNRVPESITQKVGRIDPQSGSPNRFPKIPRSEMAAGQHWTGPLLISDDFSTVVADPGWSAQILSDGQMLLAENGISAEQRAPTDKQKESLREASDQVEVELLNHQLFSIAEQMGETLRSTAVSVNVKERLDFSCAIFDAAGDLLANAPHIPIHLGAMSECVKCLIEDNAKIGVGDVLVTNDPYRGGSHLPDITVATPCHDDSGQLRFWVASRAHHAEIGGAVPGSMPPHSTRLGEEGVLIQNFKLLSAEGHRFKELERLLCGGPLPSRQPKSNLADIRAQMAANQVGVVALRQLSNRLHQKKLQQLLQSIRQLASTESMKAIAEMGGGVFQFEDYMDCGAKICVTITTGKQQMVIDFTGTSPTLENNLNANRAICLSAIIYVIRLMIDKPIPLNQGILDPITICLPECFLNPAASEDPFQSPAVVGGNVETSQRIVDVLMGALGIAAASQGTTNNVLFGNADFGYYETVCGGSGASANQEGADAVQVHITNTRITDPEILETRYPVVLEEFRIRAGSGGKGIHRGGNGVVRKLRFTQPIELSVLSNRYGDHLPFGMNGGGSGQRGVLKLKKSGEWVTHLEIQTPGGGGWGRAD